MTNKSKTAAKISGGLYLGIGVLLVWIQWWSLKGYNYEPYKGYNMLQYVWLIFGLFLIASSIYILLSN